jgi:hypothetical protein
MRHAACLRAYGALSAASFDIHDLLKFRPLVGTSVSLATIV